MKRVAMVAMVLAGCASTVRPAPDGWAPGDVNGALALRFANGERVDVDTQLATCRVDHGHLWLEISDGPNQWRMSGELGNGSLINGNLVLMTPSIGTFSQNIPICSATWDGRGGRVHCAVCGVHGTVDADYRVDTCEGQ